MSTAPTGPRPVPLHPTADSVSESSDTARIAREALAEARSALADVRSMRHQLATVDASVCRIEDDYKHEARRMRGQVAKVSEASAKLRRLQAEVDETLARIKALGLR